jgi:hypothetical protein
MTSAIADTPADAGQVEYRTTDGACLVCVTSRSLDDDTPKLGTVRWEIHVEGRLNRGRAVGFECRHGHSSEDDPALLKAFPSRLF